MNDSFLQKCAIHLVKRFVELYLLLVKAKCVSNSVFCSETCIICMISGPCHSVNDIFILGWDVTRRKLVVMAFQDYTVWYPRRAMITYVHVAYTCFISSILIHSYSHTQLKIFYLPILLKIHTKIPKLMWPSSYENEVLSCTPEKSMFDYV